VNSRTPDWVVFGLAQHFARDRRGIALAERKELQQVRDRMTFHQAVV